MILEKAVTTRRIESRHVSLQHVIILIASACLVSYLLFTPVAIGGLYGDDQLNALTRGYTITSFGSLGNMIFTISKAWIGQSRIYPLAFAITYSFWYAINSHIFFAKFINISAMLLCTIFFASVVLRITRDYTTFFTIILMTPLCMQTRGSFDAVSQFPLLLPVTMLLITLQIRSSLNYADQGRWRDLFACAAAFATGMLIYELALVAVPIVVLLVLLRTRNIGKTLRLSATYAAIVIPYVVAVSILRHMGRTYEGIEINIGTGTVHSFLVNLYAAVPLSSLTSPPRALFPSWTDVMTTVPAILTGIVAVGYMIVAVPVLTPRPARSPRLHATLVAVLLIALPAALLSISKRYQAEITSFGDSYIQVFIENFGMALLISIGISALLHKAAEPRARAALIVALVVACGALGGIGFMHNVRVADYMDRAHQSAEHDLLSKAVHYGLLEQTPAGQDIFFDPQPGLIPEFFPQYDRSMTTPVSIKAIGPTETPQVGAFRVRVLPFPGSTSSVFSRRSGVVILSRVDGSASGQQAESVLKVMSIGSGIDALAVFSRSITGSPATYDRSEVVCDAPAGHSDVHRCSVPAGQIQPPIYVARR